MKFCTRFVNAHYEAYGTYKFVWGWWFPRQLSMSEFRIGELEYEMVTDENKKPCISIHIPSDAVLRNSELRKSYMDAKEFFKQYYPEYANTYMFTNSWLLSPALKKMLSESSGIMNFQKNFDVKNVDYDKKEPLVWIYKREDIPFEDLPEDTRLQREVKKYLLNGGKIGRAYGVLKENPFCES